MYAAASALSEMMIALEIAIDGGANLSVSASRIVCSLAGKDSLSMAARAVHESTGQAELVKCPGALVISSYVPCPDITLTVTPSTL